MVEREAFLTELSARRTERRKADELHEALLVEAAKYEPDAEHVKNLVVNHVASKRLRLSDTQFAEFEMYAEFEDEACYLFLKPLGGLTWELAKEFARDLER